ncbi:13991_t:CDS:1, partial [Acaulospora colombiana]
MPQDLTAQVTISKTSFEINQSTNWSEEVENNITATKNPTVNRPGSITTILHMETQE